MYSFKSAPPPPSPQSKSLSYATGDDIIVKVKIYKASSLHRFHISLQL